MAGLIRSDLLLIMIETALRLPPPKDADLTERVRLICEEVTRLRTKANELDAVDRRLAGLPPAPGDPTFDLQKGLQ